MSIIEPPSEPHYADSTITLHHGDCLDVPGGNNHLCVGPKGKVIVCTEVHDGAWSA